MGDPAAKFLEDPHSSAGDPPPSQPLLEQFGRLLAKDGNKSNREPSYMQASGGIAFSLVVILLIALTIVVCYNVCKKCNWKIGSQSQLAKKVQSIEMAEGQIV